MTEKWFSKLEKFLFISFLFLLPTQLGFHFWPNWSFVFGIRVDLLSPTIYLTDVLVVLLFTLKIFKDKKFFNDLKRQKIIIVLVLLFSVVNCFFSTSPLISIYKWLKIYELFFVVYYLYKQEVIGLTHIVKTLFYSSITFSLIGIFQFIKSGTIGGLLYFLGERSFNMQAPGIALVSLNGAEHLRAYSTFSHPNSLAGFLGATLLFILLSGYVKKTFLNLIGVLVILTCFVLTFSVSAYLGIFVAFSFYLFSKNAKSFKFLVLTFLFVSILGSLLLPLMSFWLLQVFPFLGKNIGERLDLAFISGKMISQRFWMGEGLGTFIVNIPKYKGIFSYSWLLQPVHNIFLLFFAETGVLGLLTFCFIVYKTLFNQLKNVVLYLLLPFLFILFTGLFDHYWLTLQQNLLLVSILLGLSIRISLLWKKV